MGWFFPCLQMSHWQQDVSMLRLQARHNRGLEGLTVEQSPGISAGKLHRAKGKLGAPKCDANQLA